MKIAAIVIVFLLYILINLYLGFRTLGYIRMLLPFVGVKLYWAVFILLCLSIFISYSLGSSPFARIARNISNYWMGTFLYLLLAVLLVDILRGICGVTVLLSPSFLASRGFNRVLALLVLLSTLLVISYGIYNARRIKVTDYSLSINKAASLESINLVLISDIHLGYNIEKKEVKRIVEKINALNPDVVAIAGDVFDNDYSAVEDADEIMILLKGIKSIYGTYAVLGNHDVDFSMRRYNDLEPQAEDRISAFFDMAGIKLLKDEYVLINNSFYIGGRLDEAPIGSREEERLELKTILKDVDMEKPLILLDHRPTAVKEAEDNGVDLLLSGHTHRGQLFPGNLVTRAMYTVDYGYYKQGSLQAIVSSGVGFWGPPMRVGSSCEVVNIKISFNE